MSDELTNFSPRHLFYHLLGSRVENQNGNKVPTALLLLDLDRFREINHTLGHRVGDLLLDQITPRLSGLLSQSDWAGRLGGDEFAVVLQPGGLDRAVQVSQGILKALDEPFVIEGLKLDIQGSVGISLFPEHAASSDRLIQQADVAMYKAKAESRGFSVYEPQENPYNPDRLTLIGDLRRAVVEDQLNVLFQPKISLQTGAITGVEALTRWQHPKFGVIGPDKIIPHAEHTGFIMPFTLWVLHRALEQCRLWRKSNLPFPVAVNLSAKNLQAPELPDQVAGLLKTCDVPPSFLRFEITETAIMAESSETFLNLNRLREMGVRFSIDDFGTGYSSLSYLKKLPVDEIKIDKSFVLNLAIDDEDVAIVQSIIDLGHTLGLKVTAEGVENQKTKEKLAALKCDEMQGYHFSRPITAAEVTRHLLEERWFLKL